LVGCGRWRPSISDKCNGVDCRGGVRVGLEDNIFYDRNRKKLTANIELLRRIIKVANMLDCKPYKVSDLRKILNLELNGGRRE